MSAAKKKTTAVAKKEESTAPALTDQFSDMMDAEEDIDSKDLLLSKVVAMQGMSELVQEEKAKLGELRDTLSGTLLAKKEEPLEVIFFQPFKTWVVFKGSDYVRTEPYTAENANREREEGEETFFRTQNYYCLLASEVEKGEYTPRAISFRSTNARTGKKVESRRAFLRKFGKALPFQVFNVYTEKKQNDKGTWYGLQVSESRDSTEAELRAVSDWMKVIKASTVQVDDSDMKGDVVDVEAREEGEVRETDQY